LMWRHESQLAAMKVSRFPSTVTRSMDRNNPEDTAVLDSLRVPGEGILQYLRDLLVLCWWVW
jgi:hypothetical protein